MQRCSARSGDGTGELAPRESSGADTGPVEGKGPVEGNATHSNKKGTRGSPQVP